MSDSINRRLDALESRFAAHRPPSFEEFESKWAGMSELDHAAYEGAALGVTQW